MFFNLGGGESQIRSFGPSKVKRNIFVQTLKISFDEVEMIEPSGITATTS